MRNVGIIGMGNMGYHLSKLIYRNHLESLLRVSHIRQNELQKDSKDIYDKVIGMLDTDDNSTIVKESEVIFLTVKPKDIKSLCYEINNCLSETKENKTIVSVAAGIDSHQIHAWLNNYNNPRFHVIRCMPNIPISIGRGSIIWYESEPKLLNKNLLLRITAGTISRWVKEEHLIDAATVITGCSPAFIARYVESCNKACQDLGFGPTYTRYLLLNTFEGTLKMLKDLAEKDLILQVTSPDGATESGLKILDQELDKIVKESIIASFNKILNIKKNY